MSKKKNEQPETIKLTNGEMEAMIFNQAFAKAIKQPFPVKTAYWLGRALDRLQQEYKPYQKLVQEIVEKYAERDEQKKNRPVKRKPDGQPAWGANEKKAQAEIEELKAIEVDLGIHRIALDLEACQKMNLTPSPESFALLMPLLEEIAE